jgi:hypothetical protein
VPRFIPGCLLVQLLAGFNSISTISISINTSVMLWWSQTPQ